MVERAVWDREAASSSLVVPTQFSLGTGLSRPLV